MNLKWSYALAFILIPLVIEAEILDVVKKDIDIINATEKQTLMSNSLHKGVMNATAKQTLLKSNSNKTTFYESATNYSTESTQTSMIYSSTPLEQDDHVITLVSQSSIVPATNTSYESTQRSMINSSTPLEDDNVITLLSQSTNVSDDLVHVSLRRASDNRTYSEFGLLEFEFPFEAEEYVFSSYSSTTYRDGITIQKDNTTNDWTKFNLTFWAFSVTGYVVSFLSFDQIEIRHRNTVIAASHYPFVIILRNHKAVTIDLRSLMPTPVEVSIRIASGEITNSTFGQLVMSFFSQTDEYSFTITPNPKTLLTKGKTIKKVLRTNLIPDWTKLQLTYVAAGDDWDQQFIEIDQIEIRNGNNVKLISYQPFVIVLKSGENKTIVDTYSQRCPVIEVSILISSASHYLTGNFTMSIPHEEETFMIAKSIYGHLRPGETLFSAIRICNLVNGTKFHLTFHSSSRRSGREEEYVVVDRVMINYGNSFKCILISQSDLVFRHATPNTLQLQHNSSCSQALATGSIK